MKRLIKLNKFLQGLGARISGLSILSMMIIIVLDVILRNIFKVPIPGSYTIIENFLMPIAIFPALGYVYMENVLPRLGEFISKRPEWFQKFNTLLLLVIDMIVFSLLIYFGFLFSMNGFNEQMAIPIATKLVEIWPIYFLVPLGYVLVLMEVVLRFVKEIKFVAIPKS